MNARRPALLAAAVLAGALSSAAPPASEASAGAPVREPTYRALSRADRAIPAGFQCRSCDRMDCRQRAFPPVHHKLAIEEHVRGLSAYVSAPKA